MTYVKLANLAVFMLTTFLIVQIKNVEAGQCARVGMRCSRALPNPCGDIVTCRCVHLHLVGSTCIDYTGDGL
ncbi:leginsulin related MtN11/16/17 family [Medicago truncatula]|uniref:Leginsulin related MtN11/16/17 family n=1 Tax=Medicago truncatula TaxID=3880 RepID=A0A072TG57_MEDTR|nr:leginsulin related MtN11/16/17 family [Medicago truncatula]